VEITFTEFTTLPSLQGEASGATISSPLRMLILFDLEYTDAQGDLFM